MSIEITWHCDQCPEGDSRFCYENFRSIKGMMNGILKGEDEGRQETRSAGGLICPNDANHGPMEFFSLNLD